MPIPEARILPSTACNSHSHGEVAPGKCADGTAPPPVTGKVPVTPNTRILADTGWPTRPAQLVAKG
jgi:hypothetical protein